MTTCAEQQNDEREVLSSIYSGDDCFNEISSAEFQYKFGKWIDR